MKDHVLRSKRRLKDKETYRRCSGGARLELKRKRKRFVKLVQVLWYWLRFCGIGLGFVVSVKRVKD